MTHIIERVKTKQDAKHPLNDELSGKRVAVRLLEPGSCMILAMVDEEKHLRTSTVEAVTADWQNENHAIVQTANSVYVLKREKETAVCV